MSEFAILFLIVVFAFFIYDKIQKIKLPLWFFIGFVGFFIGFLILYFNPGHSERASLPVFRTGDLLHGYFTIGEILALPLGDFLKRFSSLYTGSKRFLIISIIAIGVCFKLPILVLPLLILLGICCSVRCQNKLFFILAVLFALHFLAVAINIQIMHIPARARMHWRIIQLAEFCVALQIASNFFTLKTKKMAANVVLLATFCYALFALEACCDMRIKWEKMAASVAAQKAMGRREEVVVDKRTFESYWKNYEDWVLPTDEVNGGTYSRYFGVKRFTAK